MNKILPVAKPLIDSYPMYGATFSILGAQEQDYLPWVYNLFVQIFTRRTYERTNQLNYVVPDVLFMCPLFETIKLTRDVALENTTAVELIKRFINNDYFFYSFFDVKQIAAYAHFKPPYHECFIYGYDDEKEIFYFADNYVHGKYSHGIATYEEIENATRSVTKMFEGQRDSIGFRGIRCAKNETHTIQFDKELYINLLKDYIEERDSSRFWKIPGVVVESYKDRKWGIGVYSYILDYLGWVEKYMDRRGFYILREHKQILEKSLTYILGDTWKDEHLDIWELLKKSIEWSTISLNLCLKYNMTLNKTLIERIRESIIKLEQNDRKLFLCIIDLLESNEYKSNI